MTSLGHRRSLHAVAAFVALGGGVGIAAAQGGARYTAVLADGSVVNGVEVSDWHEVDSAPRIGSTKLYPSNNPVRVLLDETLAAPKTPPDAFCEFRGGDRLPGLVRFHQPANDAEGVPEHLVVAPIGAAANDARAARVRVDAIRRIVWKAILEQEKPGAAVTRDGRETRFRSMRWLNQGVQLLTETGIEEFTFEALAELHPATADATAEEWEQLFRERERLMVRDDDLFLRMESSDGLRVTTTTRWRAPAGRIGGNYSLLRHALGPAWSLDAIILPHRQAARAVFWKPSEWPLSRVPPVDERHSTIFTGWRWRCDANVMGAPMRSAGRLAGWGFGVHGAQELLFALPSSATSFRVLVGLDDGVGAGGCARVSAGLTNGGSRHESPVLIGSEKLHALPPLPLPTGTSRTLRLAVDPMLENHPSNADPLDIRDFVNWIDPALEMNGAWRTMPRQLVCDPRQLAPTHGWKPMGSGSSDSGLQPYWDEAGRRFGLALRVGANPLVLEKLASADDGGKWLAARAVSLDRSATGHIELAAGEAGSASGLILPTAAAVRWTAIQLPKTGQPVPLRATLKARQQGIAVEFRDLGLRDERPR